MKGKSQISGNLEFLGQFVFTIELCLTGRMRFSSCLSFAVRHEHTSEGRPRMNRESVRYAARLIRLQRLLVKG